MCRCEEHGFASASNGASGVGVCQRELSEVMAVQPKKRPPFPKGTPPSLQALVEQCWAAAQHARPCMAEIEARLRSGKVGGFVWATFLVPLCAFRSTDGRCVRQVAWVAAAMPWEGKPGKEATELWLASVRFDSHNETVCAWVQDGSEGLASLEEMVNAYDEAIADEDLDVEDTDLAELMGEDEMDLNEEESETFTAALRTLLQPTTSEDQAPEETPEQIIARMTQEAAARDEQLAAKDEQLTVKDGQLATNQKQLASKNEQLAAKDEQLAAKDEHYQTEIMRLTKENAALRAAATNEEGIPPPS
eukprot:COSAG01_NODE_3438_length_6097_cov_4.738746_2_plen_305_part_00